MNQKLHFNKAEEDHFNWQVYNASIAEKEKDLLQDIVVEQAALVLEVGCGEGANIFHLRSMGFNSKVIGLDYSFEKIKFCRKLKIKRADFITADALFLPFRDNSFDLVFCRNLLHHVIDRRKTILEIVRVCSPGNRIIIIEGNGYNLINSFFRKLLSFESGMKDSTPKKIYKLLMENTDRYKISDFYQKEPSNLFRAILHYKYGFPGLSKFNCIKKFFNIFEILTRRLFPRSYWAYIIAILTKIKK